MSKFDPRTLTPTKGNLLLEIFDKDMTMDGFSLAGDVETSERAVVVKKGEQGAFPMPYKVGDTVLISKFNGKRYKVEEDESVRTFIPINASQVLMYG